MSREAKQGGNETVEPPRLAAPVDALYPAEARAAGLEADVVLRLTIGPAGDVRDAVVESQAGHGFDEAARAALLGARFEPARREGTPIAARIRYVHAFRLPAPLPAAPPVAEATGADGTVLAAPEPPATMAGAAVAAAEGATALPPDEVVVRASRAAAAARLQRSAEAVRVVDTTQARREGTDMASLLNRGEGIHVRQSGGLGTYTSLSLDGLEGDQVRLFVDGVPLAFMGYGLGVANVPVDLVQRVEIYRGVVPVRFGADALGGAVNLVTDDDVDGTHAALGYQVGSFGTERVAVSARHRDDDTGLFARARAFVDSARNDYPVDAQVADDRGRLSAVRVRRFHDAYRAAGAEVETGVADTGWARRLLVRPFVSAYDKQLQNDFAVDPAYGAVPYGAVTYGDFSAGATVRYAQPVSARLRVEALAGYAYRRTYFHDTSSAIVDWLGAVVGHRVQGGELDGTPHDAITLQHAAFARLYGAYAVALHHAVRLSVSPTLTERVAEDRASASVPRTHESLVTLVGAAEYQADALGDRLENIAFAKDYVFASEGPSSFEGVAGGPSRTGGHRIGLGDGVRYRLAPRVYAKASYEWATRLPGPDELFGDGVLVSPSTDLAPETSHNVNVGITATSPATGLGAFRADVNGFVRQASQLIVMLPGARYFTYRNVFGARAVGGEAAVGWTSPGGYLALDANGTWQDFRDASPEGPFGSHDGERIPNRPWLFANASARLRLSDLGRVPDELSLGLYTRYVHDFFRSWESDGLEETKARVPSQLLHTAALTYVVRGAATVGSTLSVENVTNTRAYDYFGVPKPGRSAFFKATLEI